MRKGKKPLDSPLTEKERIKYYIRNIAFGWGCALVVLSLYLLIGIYLFAGVSFYDIGLRGIILNPNIWFTSVTLILCGIYIIAHIYEMIACLVNPKHREKEKDKLAVKYGANKTVKNLLPRSKKERKYWFFLSLTAGICEEIIFRGFLFFLLQAVFPNMPILLILVAASAIFGTAHAYQGIKGMRNAAMVGALHGCLFLVTGSLIPSMFMHFTVDISAVFLLSEDTK